MTPFACIPAQGCYELGRALPPTKETVPGRMIPLACIIGRCYELGRALALQTQVPAWHLGFFV